MLLTNGLHGRRLVCVKAAVATTVPVCEHFANISRSAQQMIYGECYITQIQAAYLVRSA
jgi:hypothetical protein